MANYGALSTIRRRVADVSRHFQFSSFHGFPSNFWNVVAHNHKSDEARRVVFSDYKKENQSLDALHLHNFIHNFKMTVN